MHMLQRGHICTVCVCVCVRVRVRVRVHVHVHSSIEYVWER